MSESSSFPYSQAILTLLLIVSMTISTPTSPSSVLEDQNPPISEIVTSLTRPFLATLDLSMNDPPEAIIHISENPSLTISSQPSSTFPTGPLLESGLQLSNPSSSLQTPPFLDARYLTDTTTVALSTNAPPESTPSPSLQTHTILHPSDRTETTSPPIDADHDPHLSQDPIQIVESPEVTVIHHYKINIIHDYIRQHDPTAESSNAQALEQDREYVFLDQGGASENPTQNIEGFKTAIERIFMKYLPVARRDQREGDQFTFELISYEVFRIFGIGFQINIYLPFTKYVKQVLDTLPEGDGTGIEYADAIEKIAYKLLEIAAAMKGNKQSLQTSCFLIILPENNFPLQLNPLLQYSS